MKLAEALAIVAKAPAQAESLPVLLACGFTPLHLQNYLAAHLQRANPGRKVRIETGLFGDLAGTIAKFAAGGPGLAAMAVEWSDLDPRLGFRQTGGWGQRVVPGILEGVSARCNQLESAIGEISSASKLVVSLPTLDLPPAFHTSGWQASEAEIALLQAVSSFAGRIVAHPSVVLVNQQRLASISPLSTRYDFRSDLNTGFPYTQSHAEALGGVFAELLKTPQPKKGLITDLDDTLWHGLVGEIGSSEVSWDLASHTQLHGLYQQLLKAMAEQGVLLAIASKNSPAIVDEALNRPDLVIDRDKVFPVEVHWEAKSGSVERILKTWNISADSVVFVDDSPMELAEVKAMHPDIECIIFPKSDYTAGLALLNRLRDLFGKPRLSEEDSYRLQSIRQGSQFSALERSGGTHNLLASAEASLTLDFTVGSADRRSLELVNKTNQFNLNGKRYNDSEWHAAISGSDAFLLAISYEDKFGPLGKIAVVKGRRVEGVLSVNAWVMSCRAFSRQIELQTITQLFEHFAVGELLFDFVPTPKNQPIADFLQSFGVSGSNSLRLSREAFSNRCPPLHHEVKLKL